MNNVIRLVAIAILSLLCRPTRATAQTSVRDDARNTEGASSQQQVPDAVSNAEIRDTIAKLSSGDNGYSFDAFYRNPEEATRILIAELKPIKRKRYPGGEHPREVWIIRALRSLTGLDFKAYTRTPLGDDEAHFLGLRDKDGVEFFGTWMSRDCDWVAPRDAQVAIIKKWRRWFEEHGHGYAYVNDRDLGHWYF